MQTGDRRETGLRKPRAASCELRVAIMDLAIRAGKGDEVVKKTCRACEPAGLP